MIEWDVWFPERKVIGKFEILKSYQDRTIPDLGERSLWAAVLMQAIDDLDPTYEAAGWDNPKVNRIRIIKSAIHWFKSSNNSFNSFIGICEAFGICPDKARRKLLNGGKG